MTSFLAPTTSDVRTPHSHAGDQAGWRYYRAAQQPSWADPAARDEVCAELAERPVLAPLSEITELRRELAGAAAGHSLVLQAGDCAESFAECTPAHAAAKESALAVLADQLAAPVGLPVVRIGRIAGQFAKPRSAPTDEVGRRQLPAFRGHIVNGEDPLPSARRHDPNRMLRAYDAAWTMAHALAERHRMHPEDGPRTWTSHEALVMDYEASLVRFDESAGAWFLGSAHLPWVGDRTRHSESAHTWLLADVVNPVACKVSGAGHPQDMLHAIDRLDPERESGRLTLITRFGADRVREQLPAIARAVKNAGHPAIWLCDPMHGNTRKTADGIKTRQLADIVKEITGFVRALRGAGLEPGGLHLETAASAVTECVGADVPDESALTVRYSSLCDPRLNPVQAAESVRAFVHAI